MEITNPFFLIGLVMTLIGAFALLTGYRGTKKSDSFKAVGAVLTVIGLVAVAGSGALAGEMAAGTATQPTVTVIGDGVRIDDSGAGVPNVVVPITTVTATIADTAGQEDTVSTFTLKYYDEGVNPSLVSANVKDSITIASGTGNTTDKLLYTGTPYDMYGDGSTVHYDVNYGTQTFTYQSTGTSQEFGIKGDNVGKIATIGDPVDHTDATFFGTNLTLGSGSTYNPTTGTLIATAGTMTYNVTKGVGFYKFPWIISVTGTGSASELHRLGMIFEWSSTDPPEGDEYDAITFTPLVGAGSLLSGTGYGGDLIDAWKNQATVPLGDVVKMGIYEKYMIMVTTAASEASYIGAADKWTLTLDDLSYEGTKGVSEGFVDNGALKGDIFLNTKATKQTENFDHTT